MKPETRSICEFFKVLSVKAAVKAPASMTLQAVFDLRECEKGSALPRNNGRRMQRRV